MPKGYPMSAAGPQSSWTAERLERAKTMYVEGCTFAQIARDLGGITRNSVCGKLIRAGCARHAKPSAPAGTKPRPRTRVAKNNHRTYDLPPDRPMPVSTPVPRQCEPVALLDLRAHHCRWPVDDGLYCGATVARGAYCAAHGAVAYITPKSRPGAAYP